jgi:hypothetical protein
VIQTTPNDLLEALVGLMTRLKVKRFKKAFNILLQDIWVKVNFKKIINNEEQVLINLINVQKGFIGGHSNITKKIRIKKIQIYYFWPFTTVLIIIGSI